MREVKRLNSYLSARPYFQCFALVTDNNRQLSIILIFCYMLWVASCESPMRSIGQVPLDLGGDIEAR